MTNYCRNHIHLYPCFNNCECDIYRAAEMGDEVIVRMRLPRYVNPEKVSFLVFFP